MKLQGFNLKLDNKKVGKFAIKYYLYNGNTADRSYSPENMPLTRSISPSVWASSSPRICAMIP